MGVCFFHPSALVFTLLCLIPSTTHHLHFVFLVHLCSSPPFLSCPPYLSPSPSLSTSLSPSQPPPPPLLLSVLPSPPRPPYSCLSFPPLLPLPLLLSHSQTGFWKFNVPLISNVGLTCLDFTYPVSGDENFTGCKLACFQKPLPVLSQCNTPPDHVSSSHFLSLKSPCFVLTFTHKILCLIINNW